MMSDILSPLCLLPPSLDTAWRGMAPADSTHKVARRGDSPIKLASPLFWFDPPWHLLAMETADALAACVAERGITVSALHRDLTPPGGESRFLRAVASGRQTESDARAPRMLPYRPERYGLAVEDFDDCGIVDLRLSVCRDESGALVFSQSQIQRWESTTDANTVAGGSWVPAATFPPDVVSLDHVGTKVSQLRKLSPGAAVFASLGPFRVADEIKRLLRRRSDSQFMLDGVIVRLDQGQLTPLQLAQQTRHIRQRIDAAGERNLPLWIVPGKISADDAARLIALGASGVAVDSWCDELVDELSEPSEATAAAFGYASAGIVITGEQAYERLDAWVSDTLAPSVERFTGLCRSFNTDPTDRLGSFDRQWADSLGVKFVGVE